MCGCVVSDFPHRVAFHNGSERGYQFLSTLTTNETRKQISAFVCTFVDTIGERGAHHGNATMAEWCHAKYFDSKHHIVPIDE